MTTYYVGPGGSDASNGQSWANRKLTINGAEDIPVAAGDIVYVAPGLYRESLTVDVAGSSGSPVIYIGDVTGEHTDSIGGPVRITGSNDDQTITRNACITMANNRSFRTFRGFEMDSTASNTINVSASSSSLIVEDCFFQSGSSTAAAIIVNGTGTDSIIRRCVFFTQGPAIQFTHTATVNTANHLIENCLVLVGGQAIAIRVDRVGGITVKNCTVFGGQNSIRVQTALAGGQVLTVYNCICGGANTSLVATTTAEFTEDYNNIFGNTTARSNVTAGSNSNAYPTLFNPILLLAGHRFPFRLGELSKWSLLARLAGTNESSDDIFGMTRPATSSKKSWGTYQDDPSSRSTTQVRGGSVASLKLSDAGRTQFYVPVTNVSTTISVYVYREANYAGTAPQMIIRQPGQSARTTTDAGSASAFNQLTDTFTPAASPPYVIVELVSNNTATSSSYATYWEDLDVS